MLGADIKKIENFSFQSSEWVNVSGAKKYLPHCANTHHDIIDLEVCEMVRNRRTAYLKNGKWLFYDIKKIVTLCLADYT